MVGIELNGFFMGEAKMKELDFELIPHKPPSLYIMTPAQERNHY
jgi:hypothetical protein